MARGLALLLSSLALLQGVLSIGQDTCVTFKSGSGTFPVVSDKKASPILISADDWPGAQLAASDFAADIQRVTSVKPSLTNFTLTSASTDKLKSTTPIIIGTLGKSSLIDQIVNNTKLDVTGIQGKWEAFLGRIVEKPLPGVDRAYVIIGA